VRPYSSPFDLGPYDPCEKFCWSLYFWSFYGFVSIILDGALGIVLLLGLCFFFPFARMCFRLVPVQFEGHCRQWDGGRVSDDPRVVGICLVLNFFWFLLAGWLMAIVHLGLALFSVCILVGWFNASIHWNMFKLCIAPFGRHISAVDAPFVSRMTFWELANYEPGRIYFQSGPYVPPAYFPQQAQLMIPAYVPPQGQQQQHVNSLYPIAPLPSAPRMSEIE
jgi:uncharacterized membrane protein YccF (DUF307 family)